LNALAVVSGHVLAHGSSVSNVTGDWPDAGTKASDGSRQLYTAVFDVTTGNALGLNVYGGAGVETMRGAAGQWVAATCNGSPFDAGMMRFPCDGGTDALLLKIHP